MRFISRVDTDDGRLTAKKTYQGELMMIPAAGLRVVLFDNLSEWMSFNPMVLYPEELGQPEPKRPTQSPKARRLVGKR